MKINNKNKGLTLIEVIIYIGLFAIMIGGVLVSVFQIAQNTGKGETAVLVAEEMNFIKKKIDFTLSSMTSITSPTSGSANILQIKQGSTNITIRKNASGNIEICTGGTCEDISSVNVKVENLSFTYISPIGTEPAGINTSITINGRQTSFTKYIRP